MSADELSNQIPEKYSLSEILENDQREFGHSGNIEDYTCFTCQDWKECPYSFDAYNTGGDCLAMK